MPAATKAQATPAPEGEPPAAARKLFARVVVSTHGFRFVSLRDLDGHAIHPAIEAAGLRPGDIVEIRAVEGVRFNG